jgi:hypothetical protein
MSSTAAQNHPTFDSLWMEAQHMGTVFFTEHADYTVITSDKGLTNYYFTKPNNPADSAVVKTEVYQRNDGTWDHRENGFSFTPATRTAFAKWMDQIVAKNVTLRDAIVKARSGVPSPPN